MKIRFKIKTVIRWEQLRGKSFSLMDYADKDDVETLLYATTICINEGQMYTLKEFRLTQANDKVTAEMVKSLEREMSVLAQFQKNKGLPVSNSESDNSETIGSIVSLLIMNGLEANYAYNEMELCDLPLFIEAYERKRKEQMESSRLWTYLSILPHVDGRKIPSPQELYAFPWEEKEMEEKAMQAIQEDADKLEAFFNRGKNLINQNYGE